MEPALSNFSFWARRDRAERRRLRVWLLGLSSAALMGMLLGVLLGLPGVAGPAALLTSTGVLLPLAWLAATVAVIVALRARYGRVQVRLDEQALGVTPSVLRRAFPGIAAQQVPWPEVTDLRFLDVARGAHLAVFGPRDESPVLVPLARPEASGWLAEITRRCPACADPLSDRARDLANVPRPERGPPGSWSDAAVRFLEAAGHWQLAAAALWPRVLARPDDAALALRLLAVEQRRLPPGLRLRLAEALLQHHPDQSALLLELARGYLALRWQAPAQTVLDRLVTGPEPLPAIVHLRAVLRERKELPAPPSRAAFGFEVGPARHRLEGRALLVEGRYRVGLEWFVGYRLVPGFWGPPRGIEIVDVWGKSWALAGEPLPIAAALEQAASHLVSLEGDGFLWPGTGGRIRLLHRAARHPRETSGQ